MALKTNLNISPYYDDYHEDDNIHLILVMTANRGLCGGFNSNIIRSARRMINDLISNQKEVKIIENKEVCIPMIVLGRSPKEDHQLEWISEKFIYELTIAD